MYMALVFRHVRRPELSEHVLHLPYTASQVIDISLPASAYRSENLKIIPATTNSTAPTEKAG
jgi:hypothetical protein